MSDLPRIKYVQFRASEPEILTLNRLSNRMGLTLSETMRALIREAATTRGLPDVGMADLYEKYPALAKVQNGQPQQP
jgi:antitoxin component of RelBE/YafQ-DinJ toxin-antitoxin module